VASGHSYAAVCTATASAGDGAYSHGRSLRHSEHCRLAQGEAGGVNELNQEGAPRPDLADVKDFVRFLMHQSEGRTNQFIYSSL